MELFLLVSMALTIVTFLLIVVSEPAAPSIAEHDSDYAAEFLPEESMAEMRDPVVSTVPDAAIIPNQGTQAIQLAL